MVTSYRQAVFDEDLRRKLSGIFPGQSLTSMQPVSASSQDISTPDSTFTAGATIPQEPMPERIDAGEYLDAISEINARRSKMAGRANAMLGLTGRPQNFSFGPIAGEQELKQRMGLRDEEIQNEILKRQRAAILRGDINNIDEQMAWYQKGGYDPHFAKTAREAAQSIFDQRYQEEGQVRAREGEVRAKAGEVRAKDEAVRAAERFKFAQAEAKRKQQEFNASQTTEARNELIALRENELLAWAADKWWALEPGERTEAKREEIAREMSVLARDKDFKGFSVIAGRTVPNVGRGITTTPPVPVDLNEKSLIDTFRNEAKVVLKDEDKEDEDFVSVPARTYSDQYEQQWRTAADDFETASNLAETINAAIRADESIAPENKQAVLEKVLKNLESVEKGVGRPTEPSPQAAVVREKRLEDRLFERTDNVKADMANSTRVFNELMDRYSQNNPYLAQMTLGLREAQVFDRMISIMSYGPNPLSMPMVEEFRNNVANVGDDIAAKETHLRWFAETNRIPMRMAEYILNPEEYKKRQF